MVRYIILICLLVGCSQKSEIKEIDGCEYIIVKDEFGVKAITHKGNCTNIIHEYNDTDDYVPIKRHNNYVRFKLPNNKHRMGN